MGRGAEVEAADQRPGGGVDDLQGAVLDGVHVATVGLHEVALVDAGLLGVGGRAATVAFRRRRCRWSGGRAGHRRGRAAGAVLGEPHALVEPPRRHPFQRFRPGVAEELLARAELLERPRRLAEAARPHGPVRPGHRLHGRG